MFATQVKELFMDKEQTAIKRLQEASKMSLDVYEQPLVVTTSGGKDSSVCIELALRSRIPFEVMHNLTTADAPETVYFIRNEFKKLEEKGIKCTINYPYYKGKRTSMWNLIPQKLMPPTRLVRYCCEVLKETGGENRFIVTGVRWDESTKRKNTRGIYEKIDRKQENRIILTNDNDEKRTLFENCKLKAKRVCNPIIDWTDSDVWNFLRSEKVNVNPLYECGFSRVGCIGCPMASKKGREIEFIKYPKYKKLYIKAFDRMLKERIKKNKSTESWDTGIDVFNWWMEYDVLSGQIGFFNEMED